MTASAVPSARPAPPTFVAFDYGARRLGVAGQSLRPGRHRPSPDEPEGEPEGLRNDGKQGGFPERGAMQHEGQIPPLARAPQRSRPPLLAPGRGA